MLRDLAQPSHLLILAVLIALLFGWKKLPDVTRSVGRSMRIFKTEVAEMKNDGKESKPSAAASDTVAGDVVRPQPAAQQTGSPPGAAQPQPAAAQPAAAQPGVAQPAAAQPQAEAQPAVTQPTVQPQPEAQARYDHPAR
ncbi:MAG: Sec-independent protein translocase subunit TatA [Lapillicoccus sp.]